jgi:DNA-binding MarR family transcriptional regulator
MKATSLMAWDKVSRELTQRQMDVFEKVYDCPGITIREVSVKLKTTPNCISGRFCEMEKKGLIIPQGVRYFQDKKGRNDPHTMYFINKRKAKV